MRSPNPPATAPDQPVFGWAAGAARRGFAVIPLKPLLKEPVWRNWEARASTDPERIHRWPARTTGYGVATGPSGLIVLDLDLPKPGELDNLPLNWADVPGIRDGADAFAELCERNGGDLAEAFETLVVETPGHDGKHGTHLYYRAPQGTELRNTCRTVAPMIDTRGHGGYVCGPGTVTSAGTYRVVHFAPPAELPAWLSELLTTRPAVVEQRASQAGASVLSGGFGAGSPSAEVKRPEAYARAVLRRAVVAAESAQPGRRNQVLFAAAANCRPFIAAGQLDSAAVRVDLAEAAGRAGLEPREIQRTIESGLSGARTAGKVAA